MRSKWSVIWAFCVGSVAAPAAAEVRTPTSTPSDQPLSLTQNARPAVPVRRAFPESRALTQNRVRYLPAYVRPFESFWQPEARIDWLQFGMQHRTRYELQSDSDRVGLLSDERFLMRTRGYLGITDVIDPLRLGVEFLDARVLSNGFPESTFDIDHADILQAFVELYFRDAIDDGFPVIFRFGRQAYDNGDRRLFARNRWPNVSNSFDGFRLRLGDERTIWEVDMFAFQPVDRRLYSPNPNDEDRAFYGIVGYLRHWSPYLTLEPFYFVLDEDFEEPDTIDTETHTLGLRGYGTFGAEHNWYYDANTVMQLGDTEDGDIRAFAFAMEMGYTFNDLPWQPKVAGLFNYATGDRNPTDRLDESFRPLFGAPLLFYGLSESFDWQNLINPAVLFAVQPTERLNINTLYRVYWLDSDVDSFPRAGIVDPTGTSGNFVGQELDILASYRIDRHTTLDIGYAHFMPGTFTRSAGDDISDSDFFFVQMEISY